MVHRSFLLDDIPWEQEASDGTRLATLAGSRDPGCMFTYAFFMPANFWDGPHRHGSDVHLLVASGELRLTFSADGDPGSADIYPPGAFLEVEAGAVHADGSTVETIIIGTAIGPWSTSYP